MTPQRRSSPAKKQQRIDGAQGQRGRKRDCADRMAALQALALTDNAAETARITGIPTRTLSDWLQDADFAMQVEMRRVELSQRIKGQFDASIIEAQQTIRYFLRRLRQDEPTRRPDGTYGPTPEQLLVEISEHLFTLGKLVAIETERRQVLADLPAIITETRGVDPAKERAQDKEYLRGLLDELDDERGQ